MFERLRSAMAGLSKQGLVQTIGAALFSPVSTGGTPPKLGTKELLEAYSKMPWLRAVANKVAQSVGNTNWQLFVVRPGGGNNRAVRMEKLQRADFPFRKKLLKDLHTHGDLQEIQEHPLLELLNRGNDAMLGGPMLQVTEVHLDLAGEAFWLIERDKLLTPVSLWPLPPFWVRSFPTKEKPFYRILIKSTEIEIPMSEIIPFIDFDPANPYSRGSGIAKSLGDELETDEYAAKHLKNFFFNRARPDLIISGDNLSREDTIRLEERWLEQHKGFWQAFKPHFVSREINITELGQTFEHMQMIEIRKHERDLVINVFGFPPEKFGILTQSNRSTIDAADFFWSKDIVLPRVERVRSILQHRLVPLFDDRLVLDFTSPIAEDREFELKAMRVATWAHSVNEWRKLAGQKPLEDGGDVHLIPMNMFPVDLAGGESPPAPAPPTPPPDQPEASKEALIRRVSSLMPTIEKRVMQVVKSRLRRN